MDRSLDDNHDRDSVPSERVLRVFHQSAKKAEVLIDCPSRSKRLYVEKGRDGKWMDQFGKQHRLIFPEA